MEFGFDLNEILQANKDGIVILDGLRSLKKGPQHYASGAKTHPYQELLNEVVDTAGAWSAAAQNLPVEVTNSIKFFGGEDRIFLLVDGFKAIAMLRIGNKKLFIRDEIGNIKEIEPLWLLDFYVHEKFQRSGYGKFLFEYMLDEERVEPNKIAYDRPSEKLLNFLRKHYGLENYVPQSNNFVVYSNYFALDKTYKTFVKDKLKPRGKATKPTASTSEPKYGFQNYSDPAPVEDKKNLGAMPSYKDAVNLRKQADESAYPPPPGHLGFEEEKQGYYNQPPVQDPRVQKEPVQSSGSSKRVQFAEAPQYYDIPQDSYDEHVQAQEAERDYEGARNNYTYNNYDGYQPPAGRNYQNPEIEKDQFDRKFNRTSTKFETKESFQEVFAHPESDGPLDGSIDPRKQQAPVEFDIKKTDQKIQDTNDELKKCQDRINQLKMKSEEIVNKTSQGFNSSSKFLDEENKQIYSGEKDVVKVDPSLSTYNKRFGYATVYDNKFKNIVKDPNILESERSSTLSKAGNNLLTQNPNMNVYQHQQLLRSSPFGANVGGSSYSKVTSSSAYGGFFKKDRM